MTWQKNADDLHAHRKIRKAGLEAMGLWTVAGSWVSQQLTDGFVPRWFVEGWPRGRALANRLVAAGLWEEAVDDGEKGWQFHDWLEYNPSAEQEKARKDAAAERQRRARDRARDVTVTRDRRRDEARDVLVPRPDPARPVPEKNLLGGDLTTPGGTEAPLHPDHCLDHQNVAEPGPCGSCADARKAHRKLAVVPEGYCLVHDSRYWTICSGCEADRKAAQ